MSGSPRAVLIAVWPRLSAIMALIFHPFLCQMGTFVVDAQRSGVSKYPLLIVFCLAMAAVGCGATNVCPQGSTKNTAGHCVLSPADGSSLDADASVSTADQTGGTDLTADTDMTSAVDTTPVSDTTLADADVVPDTND